MPASKDGKGWRCQFYYKDWQGNTHKKNKRGCRTKAEAETWERDFRQQQEFKPDEKSKPETELHNTVSYNPDNVVSLAIAKCRAGGMVTTEEHLKDNLNAGKITQEEYDEYFPLDGLEESYYNVFVNVDLNKASTASGKLLESEEVIAQYISDMLLLETDSVFNVRYIGVCSISGEEFYEFRCYR